MRTISLLALSGLLAACNSVPVIDVPKQVTVVVEKPIPPPDWATKPYAKPMPRDGTVGAVVESDSAKGALLDVLLCHRRLLDQLGKGKDVDPKSCEP